MKLICVGMTWKKMKGKNNRRRRWYDNYRKIECENKTTRFLSMMAKDRNVLRKFIVRFNGGETALKPCVGLYNNLIDVNQLRCYNLVACVRRRVDSLLGKPRMGGGFCSPFRPMIFF